MPTAVTHVLLTIIAVDLYRDYFYKHKKVITLHMVFLGGVFGLIPDIDIPIYWLLKNVFGISVGFFHRTYTHTFLIPLALLLFAVLFHKRHKLSIMLGIASFAVSFHIILDLVLMGYVAPFWPLSDITVGLGLLDRLAWPALMEGIDAILLLGWLWHEEKKHRITDFI